MVKISLSTLKTWVRFLGKRKIPWRSGIFQRKTVVPMGNCNDILNRIPQGENRLWAEELERPAAGSLPFPPHRHHCSSLRLTLDRLIHQQYLLSIHYVSGTVLCTRDTSGQNRPKLLYSWSFSSVQFSRSVMSDSL